MRGLLFASMLLLISAAAHAAGPAAPQLAAHTPPKEGTGHPAIPTGFLGFIPLVRLKAPPLACSAALDGAVALTSAYALCVCKGDAAAWVKQSDPAAPCSWQAAQEPGH